LVHHLFLFLLKFSRLIEQNEYGISKIKQNYTQLSWRGFLRMKDDPILDENPDTSSTKIGDMKVSYTFGDYASYKEMLKYMRTIEFYYPNLTKLIRIGRTHEKLPIEGLKIGYPVENNEKRAFWIDGNIHAREWASSHTALYFINQLISGYGRNSRITHFLDSLNIYIFPCLNPDGYEYSRSNPTPQVRLWRKNRSPETCKPSSWGGKRCCRGVDLNRNFDFHWAEAGSSSLPCSNLYHGEQVFSEPETRAVRDFMLSTRMRDKFDGFITLHTYAQLWIHPYSHEVDNYPPDYYDLRKIAKKAIEKLKKPYGIQYKIGTGANILSPASGGSDDWAKSKLNVKYVYLVELRPELELSNGFILNKKELIPTAYETWQAVQEVIDSTRSPSQDSTNHITKQPIVKQFNSQSMLTKSSSIMNGTWRISTISLPLSSLSLSSLTSPPPSSSTLSRITITKRVNSTCRDIRFSCKLWLKINRNVCIEQQSFMSIQCKKSCNFCKDE
uniref:ShKT domain-containing protein n=1 Tax=Dracunculus medinensis TaxID=318479 RepID=A0A158Q475_DRAME